MVHRVFAAVLIATAMIVAATAVIGIVQNVTIACDGPGCAGG